MNRLNLAGRVAVVTGGARGIGFAAAKRALASGASVAIWDIDRDRLTDAVAALSSEGTVSGCTVELTEATSVDDAARDTIARHGRIDVLVNNAGITRDTTFKKMDKAAWDVVIQTNLDSCFNMTKQVCDGMVERNWGRVVNISSVNGQKGAFGQTNYSAAKAGMHGFTKALALEVARKGVTVNTISPGYIGTKMVMAIPKEVLDTKIIPQIPVGRLGESEEIARAVVFLAADSAGFINGACFDINGGHYMAT
jgi:acetoacetyl-CoA reductase